MKRFSPQTIFCFSLLLIVACQSQEQKSAVIARVGEAELSYDQIKKTLGSDIDSASSASALERYIYRWVDDELLYQAAVAEGIASGPELQEELRQVRKSLIINYYVDEKLKKLPEISVKRLQDYYNANSEEFVCKETQYRYSYLICKERSFGQTALRKLRNGETFKDIVSENYPENVLNTIWDSDYITLEQGIPEIQKNIPKLKPGDLYGPVAVTSGHVVFQLQDKIEAGSVLPFERVKETIRQRLQEDWYREQYQQLLVSLKNKKVVEINLKAGMHFSAASDSQ